MTQATTHAQTFYRFDVLFEEMVRIRTNIAILSVGNQLGMIVRELVPNARSFTVYIPCTFDLIGGRSRTKQKIVRKFSVHDHIQRWCWSITFNTEKRKWKKENEIGMNESQLECILYFWRRKWNRNNENMIEFQTMCIVHGLCQQ